MQLILIRDQLDSCPMIKFCARIRRTRVRNCVNDPSAGSPTETLLRLILPLSDMVYESFQAKAIIWISSVRIIHRITQSVGATGGVYKGQGRNQRKLMTCTY